MSFTHSDNVAHGLLCAGKALYHEWRDGNHGTATSDVSVDTVGKRNDNRSTAVGGRIFLVSSADYLGKGLVSQYPSILRQFQYPSILRQAGQTFEGSFSAVLKPIFASKYSLESSRPDLHKRIFVQISDSKFQLIVGIFSLNN